MIEKVSEKKGTGKYINNTMPGRYECQVCRAELFTHDQKYQSDIGYATFFHGNQETLEDYNEDTEAGREFLTAKQGNTWVRCKDCWAHLGYCCDSSEGKLGYSYVINSCALDFYMVARMKNPKDYASDMDWQKETDPQHELNEDMKKLEKELAGKTLNDFPDIEKELADMEKNLEKKTEVLEEKIPLKMRF